MTPQNRCGAAVAGDRLAWSDCGAFILSFWRWLEEGIPCSKIQQGVRRLNHTCLRVDLISCYVNRRFQVYIRFWYPCTVFWFVQIMVRPSWRDARHSLVAPGLSPEKCRSQDLVRRVKGHMCLFLLCFIYLAGTEKSRSFDDIKNELQTYFICVRVWWSRDCFSSNNLMWRSRRLPIVPAHEQHVTHAHERQSYEKFRWRTTCHMNDIQTYVPVSTR